MSDTFQLGTLSPGSLRPAIGLATLRAGGLAIFDFAFTADPEGITAAIHQLSDVIQAPFGVRLNGDDPKALETILADPPNHVRTVILTTTRPLELREPVRRLQERRVATLLEVTCLAQAKGAEEIGAGGLVAKGHEAGGRVADETTFILLQRFRAEVSLPVWAYGGIGVHTAAACAAAGASGVILDSQLALTRESPFSESLKARIASMDGSETICVGDLLGETYRIYFRPGSPVVKELQELESCLASDPRPSQDVQTEWRGAVAKLAGWDPEKDAVMLGQDAAFAAPLAERYRTVGGILQAIRDAVRTQCEGAFQLRPFAEGSALAKANGTRYPILQGPMTRVSDVPDFAVRVAEGGALPFLALALMRGPEVRAVLAEAQKKMGKLPWGVGVLGFVPQELRQEQMDIISEFRPPFALIAGGRPDHARALEQKGISTYLHVPSPGLLRMFIQQGAKRFIFEGRECGGHVGPRTSFVLWNQMVDVLLNAPEVGVKPEEFHIVFAAGIHDALSTAMVSVIAAPLAQRGVPVGVLVGTAYLFTEEAVASGAILKTFQEQAKECRETVLLESGPGHSTRCVNTPFATAFASEKRRLLSSGLPPEEIRMALEELNLGRLRVASKGVTRNPGFGADPTAPKFVEVDEVDQIAEGMYMIGQVAALRHTNCTVKSLHHEISVEGSQKLDELAGRFSQPVAAAEAPSDVAIIGMSCLLPKSPDLLAYWENILGKVNTIGEIPKERWDWQLYFDSDPKAKDKIYSRWGGFLDDVAFDPMQYGMPPASLRSIEPAQLLTLEAVRAALADAGYLNRPFARERTSVVLGAGGGAADLGLGYGARSFLPMLEELPEFQGRSAEIMDRLDGRLPEWTEDSFAGILTNVAAGRVANRFDLGGSNYTVDAACASSLAAVSLALKELEGRTSDMVIVGGIDTMQNPFTYLCFSKTHALSPRGRCRTFDESADGIAISEGIAILIFKRLADAERDGDRIYAVVKGTGSSSDGKDRGLTAPRPEGQARALKRAYAKAGFSPATIGLVEAHGTGTAAGDGAEVQALTKVFSEAQAPRQRCAIGSVKSMIGHTKCTAGAAGLVKAALALHHRVLPPTLGVEKPNPGAKFPETPFFVNTDPRPWLENPSGLPRRAGVSAFGFGGTNFHVVLEEYTGDVSPSRPSPVRNWSDELFVWRSETREGLRTGLASWSSALSADVKPLLRDLAHTSWKQAKATGLQLAIVASSLDDLKQKLAWAEKSLANAETRRINDPRGIYFSQAPIASQGKVAFLFPGQGSQYPRMLQDLLLHFPELQGVFEKAVRVLKGKLPEPLDTYVFPPPSFSPEEEKDRQHALKQTNIAQPALGAVSLAMFSLLRELGLEPDMAAGHSYGEYVALAAAGVFDADSLIALSEARGRFIVEGAVAEPGVMAAIEAQAGPVAAALEGLEDVCLANVNAPTQSVISGSRAAVEKAVEHFTAQGITARLIPVACAFHSPLVAPAQKPLAEFLATINSVPPKIPVYSNTTAEPYPVAPADIAERLVDHLVKPVEFVREVEAMYDAGARVFVEVGPRGVLSGLVDQILGDRPKLAVVSNQSGRPGLTQLLHALGQLAAAGLPLKLDRLYRDRSDRVLNMGALQSECAEKPLSPSVWLVNGARAKPLKEEATKSMQKTAMNGTGNALPHAVKPTVQAPVAAAAPPPPTPVKPVALAPAVLSDPQDGVPSVMGQFQQMMASFLETQKSVMLAYLGSDHSAPATGVPAFSVAPAIEAPVRPEPPPPIVVSPAPDPVSAPAPVVIEQAAPVIPSGPDLPEMTARLLSIVSERTGYPPEMLDLKLDLEADLGIDSIKRVEILGTFQQSFVTAGVQLAEGLMEKLSAVRTLQGVIDGVGAQFGAEQPAAIPAPAPAKAAAGPDRAALTAQLLSIVSERTGYPSEMLDLNLDLEADLGIDSIKRVEILGTFQQSFASVEEGLMEKLAGVRTLQGILDQVFEKTSAGPRPVEQTPPAAPPAADKIQRFTVKALETPIATGLAGIQKDRVILIAGGGHPLGAALADDLIRRGYRIASAGHGPETKEAAKGIYTADFHSPESVSDLLELIKSQQGQVGGIVHLLSLQDPPDSGAFGIKSLFHIAKAAGKLLREAAKAGGTSLIAVTGMGGTFLSDLSSTAHTISPEHGAVAGLMKTLAQEWPEVQVKAIDLSIEQSSQALARHVVEELLSGDKTAEVGYDGLRRITLQPVPAPLAPISPAPALFDSSSVILITGGARGITASAAKRLAELYKPTLVLVGRTPLPQAQEAPGTEGISSARELKAALMEQLRGQGETVTPALVERAYAKLTAEREVRRNLAAIRQLGAQVQYHAVDVRDSVAFGPFIDGLYEKYGRLDGVIHGAGVIEDKLIQDKTSESFDRVFETKVKSAFVLSEKLRPESLRLLLFFSSVSGRFGNRGQGDYAAANEILNKLAVCLDRKWPARVVAMIWGPWDTDGMVSAEVRKQFAERGVELISQEVGVRRLEEEMLFGQRGEAEVVIGGAAGWESPSTAVPSRRIWPLLGPDTVTRTNGKLECVVPIDPARHLYLDDHRLDGQPVLPLAIATELIAETVAHGWPNMQVTAVRDLRLLHGVVFENGPKSLKISAKQTAGESSIAVEVTAATHPFRAHYRATVEFAPRLAAPAPSNVPALPDGRAFSMDVPSLYRQWLFHGPLFQGIRRVDAVGPGGIKAVLAGSTPDGWIAGATQDRWLIDPLLFDSALQLLVLWSRDQWDMTALPSGFQSYRRFDAPPAGQVLCEMRIQPNTGGQTIHADIYFIDAATGAVLGILEDMQGACSKALNRLAGRAVMAAMAGNPS